MTASKFVALSGGVGGAKLALGLSLELPASQLLIVANTGDDFEHLGFPICPDVDTVMYTLAGLSNQSLGWGQEGETWQFLEALERIGGETWFKLGDRDLATHTLRRTLIGGGATLSEATATLCLRLGVEPQLIPMSDDPVPTIVKTPDGAELSFQHYFVRDRCAPEVSGFEFRGIEKARPAPAFRAVLEDPDLAAIIICPSNPFVSVDPVLALPGVMDAIGASAAPVIAVSPIVAGLAIKGPAAKMMRELGMPQTALAVAEHYAGRVDGFVLDDQDAGAAADVEALGMQVCVTNTVMKTEADKQALAADVLAFAAQVTAAGK